jgi:hypothetical protein
LDTDRLHEPPEALDVAAHLGFEYGWCAVGRHEAALHEFVDDLGLRNRAFQFGADTLDRRWLTSLRPPAAPARAQVSEVAHGPAGPGA